MTTVIVKEPAFEWFETNVPDHIPLRSIEGFEVEPVAGEVRSIGPAGGL